MRASARLKIRAARPVNARKARGEARRPRQQQPQCGASATPARRSLRSSSWQSARRRQRYRARLLFARIAQPRHRLAGREHCRSKPSIANATSSADWAGPGQQQAIRSNGRDGAERDGPAPGAACIRSTAGPSGEHRKNPRRTRDVAAMIGQFAAHLLGRLPQRHAGDVTAIVSAVGQRRLARRGAAKSRIARASLVHDERSRASDPRWMPDARRHARRQRHSAPGNPRDSAASRRQLRHDVRRSPRTGIEDQPTTPGRRSASALRRLRDAIRRAKPAADGAAVQPCVAGAVDLAARPAPMRSTMSPGRPPGTGRRGISIGRDLPIAQPYGDRAVFTQPMVRRST